MKLDQIAFYAHNDGQAREIKKLLGLEFGAWVVDVVVGNVYDEKRLHRGKSKGLLQFNYDLGIEVEILTYLDGWHWHMDKPEFKDGISFLSHIGFHMESFEPSRIELNDDIIQVMETISHTNPYLIEKRRKYRYEICAGSPSSLLKGIPIAVPLVGVDRKYIWRIEE